MIARKNKDFIIVTMLSVADTKMYYFFQIKIKIKFYSLTKIELPF